MSREKTPDFGDASPAKKRIAELRRRKREKREAQSEQKADSGESEQPQPARGTAPDFGKADAEASSMMAGLFDDKPRDQVQELPTEIPSIPAESKTKVAELTDGEELEVMADAYNQQLEQMYRDFRTFTEDLIDLKAQGSRISDSHYERIKSRIFGAVDFLERYAELFTDLDDAEIDKQMNKETLRNFHAEVIKAHRTLEQMRWNLEQDDEESVEESVETEEELREELVEEMSEAAKEAFADIVDYNSLSDEERKLYDQIIKKERVWHKVGDWIADRLPKKKIFGKVSVGDVLQFAGTTGAAVIIKSSMKMALGVGGFVGAAGVSALYRGGVGYLRERRRLYSAKSWEKELEEKAGYELSEIHMAVKQAINKSKVRGNHKETLSLIMKLRNIEARIKTENMDSDADAHERLLEHISAKTSSMEGETDLTGNAERLFKKMMADRNKKALTTARKGAIRGAIIGGLGWTAGSVLSEYLTGEHMPEDVESPEAETPAESAETAEQELGTITEQETQLPDPDTDPFLGAYDETVDAPETQDLGASSGEIGAGLSPNPDAFSSAQEVEFGETDEELKQAGDLIRATVEKQAAEAEQLHNAFVEQIRGLGERALEHLNSSEFIYEAERGEGYTHIARKAVHDFLVNSERLSEALESDDIFDAEEFTKAHLIFAEDYIKDQFGEQGLNLGQDVNISASLIREALTHAKEQSAENLQSIVEQYQDKISDEVWDKMLDYDEYWSGDQNMMLEFEAEAQALNDAAEQAGETAQEAGVAAQEMELSQPDTDPFLGEYDAPATTQAPEFGAPSTSAPDAGGSVETGEVLPNVDGADLDDGDDIIPEQTAQVTTSEIPQEPSPEVQVPENENSEKESGFSISEMLVASGLGAGFGGFAGMWAGSRRQKRLVESNSAEEKAKEAERLAEFYEREIIHTMAQTALDHMSSAYGLREMTSNFSETDFSTQKSSFENMNIALQYILNVVKSINWTDVRNLRFEFVDDASAKQGKEGGVVYIDGNMDPNNMVDAVIETIEQKYT